MFNQSYHICSTTYGSNINDLTFFPNIPYNNVFPIVYTFKQLILFKYTYLIILQYLNCFTSFGVKGDYLSLLNTMKIINVL